ncbi:MAG: NAD(P)-dependent oxidoreductase [Deltaproteobacteria bacterium]|jgi:D-3-phosphoglycerate dehydrogenase
MHVLIADKLASFVAGRLQDLGARIEVDPKLEGESLAARIRESDPEVLVVRSTKVQQAHFEAGKSLSLVIRAGAGVNTIDLATASARGVYVANCPGKNAAAVAELAIGHLVNLDRRIADNVAALRAHRWDKKTFGEARGLRGRTLAVLGVGQIGREVITRARAMGMRIVGWDKFLSAAEAEALGLELAPTPEAAVSGADAVTVHLAFVPETDKRIGASVFGAMKPGSYFVNTSRGEVVDEEALLEACTNKKIRAGLDVFAKEPSASTAEVNGAVFDHPNVYGTHHIGASTDEAEEAVGEETVRIVRAYQAGKPIPNCVNLAHKSAATHVVVVRHVDRVGVLAHVLRTLSEAKHNVEDMQNIVFSGNAAACARIDVVGEVSQEVLARIAESPDVFAATVSPIG